MNRAHMLQNGIRFGLIGVFSCLAGTAWGSAGACLNSSGQTVSGCSAVDGAFTSFLTPTNNDFSAPNVGTNYQYNPTIAEQGGSGWTFTSVGIAGGGTNDSGALIYGSQWYATAPPTGTQVAGLQEYNGSTSGASIAEQVGGFVVGQNYAVDFDIAQRLCGCAGGSTRPTDAGDGIQVLLGGQLLGTFTPSTNTWTAVTSGMMTASASTMTLEFYAPPAGNISTAEIDTIFTDVSIGLVDPPAPEPATVGLVLGGLAVMAGLRKFRRRGAQPLTPQLPS